MKSWRDQVQSTRQWSEPPCSVWRWSSSSSIRFRMWLVSSSCRTFMSEKTHSFFGETVILMQKLFRKDERRPNNNWNLVTNSIVRSIICSWIHSHWYTYVNLLHWHTYIFRGKLTQWQYLFLVQARQLAASQLTYISC